MAYCVNCGGEIPEGANFCVYCGKKIDKIQLNKEERRTEYVGKIYKCPLCGKEIPSFTAICPACGHEINSAENSSNLTYFIRQVEFCEKLIAENQSIGKNNFDIWSVLKRIIWIILNVFFFCIPLVIRTSLILIKINSTPKLSKEERQLANLIENFSFPNDRESILSALMFAKEKIDFISKETINQKTAYWMRLWCSKAEQLKQKSDILFPNDDIVEHTYNEIITDKSRVNKTIKIKASIGIVVFTVIISFFIYICFIQEDKTVDKDYSATFEMQNTGLFAELPIPDTNNGKIVYESEQQINIELYNISDDEYEDYVKKCREEGYSNDITKTDSTFYATDSEGYNLNIFYDSKEDVLNVYVNSYNLTENKTSSVDNN